MNEVIKIKRCKSGLRIWRSDLSQTSRFQKFSSIVSRKKCVKVQALLQNRKQIHVHWLPSSLDLTAQLIHTHLILNNDAEHNIRDTNKDFTILEKLFLTIEARRLKTIRTMWFSRTLRQGLKTHSRKFSFD